MPYIKPEKRLQFDESINNLVSLLVEDGSDSVAGNVNYIVTCLLKRYLEIKGKNYRLLNELTGTLDNTKVELQRRVLANYEELKIQENGDVK